MTRVTAAVDEVWVERGPDGRLKVTWACAGAPEQLELAWGRSADGLDHEHVMTVGASAGGAVLPEVAGPARCYVSVSVRGGPGPVVAAERRLDMAGPSNFRDLGGYRTADGRRVRWGRVFRADALSLRDADMDAFADLGVATVYDLRAAEEREANPNRLPGSHGASVREVPLISEDATGSLLDTMESGEGFLSQLYLHVLERSAANFGVLLSGLAEEERLPAVFHCSAGKDRTGMVAALLLSLLGVPRETVLDDYELTTLYRSPEKVRKSMERLSARSDLPPEVLAGVLSTPRWAMADALADLERLHGGIEGYLTGPAGADPSAAARLRDTLLR